MFLLAFPLSSAFADTPAPLPPQISNLNSQIDDARDPALLPVPQLEILYIPREDLKRAPGYSDQGVFLPLSRLLALVNEATSRSAAASPAALQPVYCTSLNLAGTLADALVLSGTLAFEAPGTGWSATRIDDGTLPWISQGTPFLGPRASSPATPSSLANTTSTSNLGHLTFDNSAFQVRRPSEPSRPHSALPSAFLARVCGSTWLFAHGPARGTIPVRALLPAPIGQADTNLKLGRIDVPCFMSVKVVPEIHFTSATMPVWAGTITNTMSGMPNLPTRLRIWPAQGQSAWLRLRRQAPLLGPWSLHTTIARMINARGAALEVTDDVILENRLLKGRRLRLGLPAGLRLLRAEAVNSSGVPQQATIQTTTDTLILTPAADLAQVAFRAVFAADLAAGQARPGDWSVPAELSHFVRLRLAASPDFVPVPRDLPPAVRPNGGKADYNEYICEGVMPPLAIDLVRRTPPQPPTVRTRMSLKRSEATAETVIGVGGPARRDLRFRTPAGWVVADLFTGKVSATPPPTQSDGNLKSQISNLKSPVPSTIQQLSPDTWTVSWDPACNPVNIHLKLHRSGAWGAPGTTATLALPLVVLDGPRPLEYEIATDWPEQLDVRPGALQALEIAPNPGTAGVPARNLDPQPNRQEERAGTPAVPGLRLRATAARPAGTLLIRGREADVRATVVTALAISEDQVRVRALLNYRITNAPASTFRFRLPAGTGQGVKIEGDRQRGREIRESTLRATPAGDEWTVVTQEGILGDFPLTLEWPLSSKPDRDPVAAPAIRPLGVTAQQGFIILESSETLQLDPRATGLAETDLADVPAVPWASNSRILRAWRYVEPAFTLRVTAAKFKPEPPLAGLVREAALTTTIAPEGARLTRAVYNLMPLSDRQFFELRLPAGAELWSVLVNGQGVKPARRPDPAGLLHLVPLPAVTGQTDAFSVSVLYREDATSLTGTSRLELRGPALNDPVARTTWNLNLPPGFEYLAYGGPMAGVASVRVPLATLLRTAYYPRNMILSEETPALVILLLTLLSVVVFLIIRHRILHPRLRPAALGPDEGLPPGGPEEAPGSEPRPPLPPSLPPNAIQEDQPRPHGRGCFGLLVQWMIIGGILLVLAAIAIPNFLEAQTRSKIARVRGDMRTLTIALESYYIDQNTIPTDPNVLWQGPVSYLSSWFSDPFTERGSYSSSDPRIQYLHGPEAINAAKAAGLIAPATAENASFYMLYSYGPDGKDDGGTICYDPSNGTTSAGDVIRAKDGISTPVYPQGQPRMAKKSAPRGSRKAAGEAINESLAPAATEPSLNGLAPAPAYFMSLYDPSNGTSSSGDVYRYKDGPTPSQPESPRTNAEGEELVPLDIRGGKPMYMGTPRDLRTPNLEGQTTDWAEFADPNDPNASPEERLRRQKEIISQRIENRGQMLQEAQRAGAAIIGDRAQSPQSGTQYVYPDSFDARGLDRSSSEALRWSYERVVMEPSVLNNAPAGAPTDRFSSRGGAYGGFAPAAPAARQAGLLSLGIEIPEGGIQRRFETLGGQARLDIRVLEENRFLRWKFLVWMAAFLVMGALWLRSRRAWRIGFVAGFAVAMVLPVLVHTPWVVFINTAFQGILFSLVVPLLAWGLGRMHRRAGVGTAALLFLVLCTLGQSARAEEPANPQASVNSAFRIPHSALDSPYRLLIPYDTTTAPLAMPDPLAFLSKDDFTRLWIAAHPELARAPQASPALAELILTGAFAPDISAIRGTLTLRAINPTDTPTTLPLALGGLTLEGAASNPPGAAIEPTGAGLVLRADARWAGRLSAGFTLRCESQGNTGRFTLDLPEAASGQWRFDFPWQALRPQGAGAAASVAETTTQGTTLLGPVRPGKLELGWTATASNIPHSAFRIPHSQAPWRAEIDNKIAWVTLSCAGWTGRLRLEGIGGGLPEQVRLPLDPGLRIHTATGEALRLTQIINNELILTLAPAQSADIRLEGLVLPPQASGATPQASHVWTVPALRTPAGAQSRTSIRLDVINVLDIISIDPQGLERRSELQPPQPEGFASRQYEASSPDWRLSLELARPAPVFAATARELFLRGAGYMRRAAAVELRPRDAALSQVRLAVPAGTRVTAVAGAGLAAWTQNGPDVHLTFDPPLTSAATLYLTALADLGGAAGELTLTPLEIPGAGEVRRTALMLVPPDSELQEIEMAGAVPRLPDANDNRLMLALLYEKVLDAHVTELFSSPRVPQAAMERLLLGEPADPEQSRRAWTLASAAPLRFRLVPLRAAAAATLYNRVTIAEGIQTLDAVLSATPRRGRLREVSVLLRLSAPDPAAASRLQATGPVRHVRTEAVDPRTLRAIVELDTPRDQAFKISFHFDQPAATDSGQPLRAAILAPEGEAGSRAWLLLRRQIEGEVNPADLAGARPADPAAVDWPDESFRPLAGDRVYELPARPAAGPAFTILRHARDEALRAFVDTMRHRSIVTADGLERNELEIVLQNQSLQFLRVALPYARERVSIYEVQVAARTVKTTLEETSGRATLVIPLIRTGLLDPELTVRVAYVAGGGPALGRTGRRTHKMPEVLEGIPVGQSSMVLMLPTEYAYSDFGGSMKRVELLDLDTDEALRASRKVEELSETVLRFKGLRQKEALDTLNVYKEKAETKLKSAKQTADAFTRNYAINQANVLDRDEIARQESLAAERASKLKAAEAAGINAGNNWGQVTQKMGMVQIAPNSRVTPVATPPPLARGWVEFPRAGEVFAFRQLQGIGDVSFAYKARAGAERGKDLVLALCLTALAALAVWRGPRLFATRRRVAALAAIICLLAIATGTALDLAIPALAVVGLLFLLLGARTPSSAP